MFVIVPLVSVTLSDCFFACCFTPSMFEVISLSALAACVMFAERSSPNSCNTTVCAPIVLIVLAIFLIVRLKLSATSVSSSLPETESFTVKSPLPSDIFLNADTVFLSGLSILIDIINTIIITIVNVTEKKLISSMRIIEMSLNACAAEVFIMTVHPVDFINALAAIYSVPRYTYLPVLLSFEFKTVFVNSDMDA